MSEFQSSFGEDITVRKSFDSDIFRGASIQFKNGTNVEQAMLQISQSTKVKNSWPVHKFYVPETQADNADGTFKLKGKLGTRSAQGSPDSNVDMLTGLDDNNSVDPPHKMMQVDQLHKKGLTGKGIKIAVIDTGVDYKHPALGGCFGPKCLVSFGYDLVGDDYWGGNEPVPDSDPMDCDGHGTHVSGIIAAQKNPAGFSGVAPGATLGHYRVFGCRGGYTTTEILIEASIMASQEKPDIISTSIGSYGNWPDAWAVLMNRLADQGIISTVANGNAGFLGALSTNPMALGDKLLGVASFNNIETPVVYHVGKVGAEGSEMANFSHAISKPSDGWDGKPGPLIALYHDVSTPNQACDPLPNDTPSLKGKIVLVGLGGCWPHYKAVNIAAKGGTHIIFYSATDSFRRVWAPVDGIKGATVISGKDGMMWTEALKNGSKVMVTVMNPKDASPIFQTSPNKISGGAPSTFTSWGPTLDMQFSPDIGGPGGNILSTIPMVDGGYEVYSGTSMATPMISGVLALMKEARQGKLDSKLAKQLLAITGKPHMFNDGKTQMDRLAPVAQQGPGMAQAFDATFTKSLVYPYSLSFNDTTHKPSHFTLKISNTGSTKVEYNIGQVAASSIYILTRDAREVDFFPHEHFKSTTELQLSHKTITVEPGKVGEVQVSITSSMADELRRVPYHSGYVTINGTDGSALSVPYQHVGTEFQSIPAMPAGSTHIWNSTDLEAGPIKTPKHFILPKQGTAQRGDEMPVLESQLILGTRYLDMRVIDVKTNANLGSIAMLPQKDLARRYLAWYWWDGALADGSYVPEGRYEITARGLRVFGDPKNPKHWDSDTSLELSISYKK